MAQSSTTVHAAALSTPQSLILSQTHRMSTAYLNTPPCRLPIPATTLKPTLRGILSLSPRVSGELATITKEIHDSRLSGGLVMEMRAIHHMDRNCLGVLDTEERYQLEDQLLEEGEVQKYLKSMCSTMTERLSKWRAAVGGI